MFCPCLYVCLSIVSKFNMEYEVCVVINSSYSFQAINLKFCTDITNILKMSMRLFEQEKIISDKITEFWT